MKQLDIYVSQAVSVNLDQKQQSNTEANKSL